MDLATVAAVMLAGAMTWAAVAKVVAPIPWRSAVERYRLPPVAARAASVLVPAGEAITAGLLVAGLRDPRLAATGAVAAAGLLGIFTIAVMRLRHRIGRRLPCGCFGGTKERDYRVVVTRNLLLIATAAYVYVTAAGVVEVTWSPSMPVLLSSCGVLLAGWLVAAASAAWRR